MARASRKDNTVVLALQGLTEGLYDMFSRRLDLVRFELVDEARRTGRWVGVLAAGAAVALLGYGLLNLTIILLFGALFEQLWVMAVAAAALAIIHMIAGGMAVRRGLHYMVEYKFQLDMTKGEFQRDRQWLKEIQNPHESAESVAIERTS